MLDIRVSQVVKSQVFQPCVLQNFLMNVDHRIGVVHFAGFRRREHPRVIGILLMFCDQQIDGFLRNGNFADGVFCFRTSDVGFACIVASCLLADGNRLVFDVQVRPLERDQFTLAQTADEFEIEHRQDATLVGGCQIGLDLLWRQDLHFVLRDFRRDTVVCRVSDNQSLLNRAVECVVQHRVDAANRRVAETRLLVLLRFAEPSVFPQVLVQPLQIAPCQLFEWNIPDARRNVQFYSAPVILGR